MRFYCLEHNKDFYAEFKWGTRVFCAVNQHDLPKRFPDEPFWEHCCLCEATWVAGKQDYPSRAICPGCGRKVDLGYLCHTCETFGLKPIESFDQDDVIVHRNSECGVCLADLSDLRWHYCLSLGKSFLSKRDECPLCDASFFPITASDLLSRMKGCNHELARINDLELEYLSLIATSIEHSDQVQFFIVAGERGAIVVPRHTTCSAIHKYAPKYQQVFDWSTECSGDVVIERPAIFEFTGTSWKLKRHGRLTGEVAPEKEEDVCVQPEIPASAVALPSPDGRDQSPPSVEQKSSPSAQGEINPLEIPNLEVPKAVSERELPTPNSLKQTTPLGPISRNEKHIRERSSSDSSLASSKSFYRSLTSGGPVSTKVIYLSASETNLTDMLEPNKDFLREVDNEQGAFVLFAISDKNGWLFPNPRVHFQKEELTPIFTSLSESQYTDLKQSIEPVPMIRVGQRRWKVNRSENGPADKRTNKAKTERSAEKINKHFVTFPISAVDCLEKMQSIGQVVRRDIVRDLVVAGPEGKGELLLIRDYSAPNNAESLFIIPRITQFISNETFNAVYVRLYDCAKPSAGDVWIVKPTTVRRVKGGWRVTIKGVLEVRQTVREPPLSALIQDTEEAHVESDSMSSVVETPPQRTKHVRAIIFSAGLFAIAILLWKFLWVSSPVPKADSMVPLPGGSFLMGRIDGEENERPPHNVTVGSFSIDTYEVTRAEYQEFVNATNRKPPSDWSNGNYPPNTARWPATGVDWYAAEAYCKWLGKRLPTEEQWEFAAKGWDARKYPWGNEWKPGNANAEIASQGLTDVDKFKGASPFGAIGMVGNAWEWTANRLIAYPGGHIPPEELGDGKVDLRVIRGGSWQSDQASATTTYRWGWPASGGKDYSNTGFRCVKNAQ